MEITSEEVEVNGKRLVGNFQKSMRDKIKEDDALIEEAAGGVVYRLIEELLGEVVGDVHRAIKLGYSDLVFSRIYDHSLDEINLPFCPEKVDSKTEDINCPKCRRLIHASRFAPHLERCMQGRSSSRLASQRIANNSKECYDDDDDWKGEKTRSFKKIDGSKKKSYKQKPYKSDVSKTQKELGNAFSPNKDSPNSLNKLMKDNFNKACIEKDKEVWIKWSVIGDDKVHLLLSKCGVKSDHTGKYCGRSLRCPLHSDAERAAARKMFTGEGMDVDDDDIEYSKNVLGGLSQLNLTPTSPTSKKKEIQKRPKY